MSAATVPGAPATRRTTVASIRRGAAMLLVPASILPVPFLGPTLLRAPRRLERQWWADVQRMMQPASHPPVIYAHRVAFSPYISPAERRGTAAPRTGAGR